MSTQTTNDNPNSAAIDGDDLDALESSLKQAIGAPNAITSSALADRHFPSDGEASPKTREAVKILMRERDLPIIGGPNGYYIPVSQDPIDDAIESLEGRIDGIRERQRLLAENWSAWNRNADDAEAILTGDKRERVENDPLLTVEDVLDHRGDGN